MLYTGESIAYVIFPQPMMSSPMMMQMPFQYPTPYPQPYAVPPAHYPQPMFWTPHYDQPPPPPQMSARPNRPRIMAPSGEAATVAEDLSRSALRCYHCGVVGHKAAHCRRNPRSEPHGTARCALHGKVRTVTHLRPHPSEDGKMVCSERNPCLGRVERRG